MSPVHYRLLSEHFQACLELSEHEREEYLSESIVGDAALREELRSLLKYDKPPARPATKPAVATPAALRAARPLAGKPFVVSFFVLGASTLLLALGLRGWTLGRLESSLKAEGIGSLQQLLESRITSIRAWADRERARMRSVLEDPVLVGQVTSLLDTVHASGEISDSLRSSPVRSQISTRMSQLPEGFGELGYSIFSPSGIVLCSSSEEQVGRSLSHGSAAYLRDLLLGEWTVSRPYPDRQLGLELHPEVQRPVLFVGGPIRGGKGQIVAFGVCFVSPERQFYGLLSAPGAVEVVTFDEKGTILNNLKDPSALRRAGLLTVPDDQTAFRVHLRDPGRELKAGTRLDYPPADWMPTRMCFSATEGGNGSDASGYRNVAGRPVLGTWAWIPELEMGVGVEKDLELVLALTQPVRSGFAFMLTIPALLMGFLFFLFGRGWLRGSGGSETRFGFYVVERPIGKGGMGDVFLANHTILGRPAALKILRESSPKTATIGRFKREARMASRLGHPNSIQIFDYGETSDGRLYYAMEYVEGLNLAQLLTLEGPLPVARALYLLRQISGALEEAHALGLLHRDLKPSNIMVGRKGGLGDVVKIVDFGIASSVSGVAEDMTRSSNLVGTPAYLAPERILRPQQLDFRSDVYSFGGVAFHMLTARNIFEGPGPTELIYQILMSKRPSPSQLRGGPLPDSLESLILACLAIEPELRPSSLRAVTDLLRSVESPDHWSQDEARTWWASNWEKVSRFSSATS